MDLAAWFSGSLAKRRLSAVVFLGCLEGTGVLKSFGAGCLTAWAYDAVRLIGGVLALDGVFDVGAVEGGYFLPKGISYCQLVHMVM